MYSNLSNYYLSMVSIHKNDRYGTKASYSSVCLMLGAQLMEAALQSQRWTGQCDPGQGASQDMVPWGAEGSLPSRKLSLCLRFLVRRAVRVREHVQ